MYFNSKMSLIIAHIDSCYVSNTVFQETVITLLLLNNCAIQLTRLTNSVFSIFLEYYIN